ncbi:MAG TPA: helix-turn-helix transcriptional regulator [Candidatus Limnocylindrales bacterium]|nr:helix-turn-helix transcriptional regulator [Candidatus Limnocylindrales bacterium]
MNGEGARQLALVRRMARTGAARAMREEAAISLREMAEAVGTSRASLSRWERFEAVPRAEAALRWARVLEGFDS